MTRPNTWLIWSWDRTQGLVNAGYEELCGGAAPWRSHPIWFHKNWRESLCSSTTSSTQPRKPTPGCLASPNKLSHPRSHHFFLRTGLWADLAGPSDPTQGPVGKAWPQLLTQLLPDPLAASEVQCLLRDRCQVQSPDLPHPSPRPHLGKRMSRGTCWLGMWA